MCNWGGGVGGCYNWTLEKLFKTSYIHEAVLIKILFEFTHISIQAGGGEWCILCLQVHGPMTGGLISGKGVRLKRISLQYRPKDSFCLRVRVANKSFFPNVVMASLFIPLMISNNFSCTKCTIIGRYTLPKAASWNSEGMGGEQE